MLVSPSKVTSASGPDWKVGPVLQALQTSKAAASERGFFMIVMSCVSAEWRVTSILPCFAGRLLLPVDFRQSDYR
jgi:hypothetical protein